MTELSLEDCRVAIDHSKRLDAWAGYLTAMAKSKQLRDDPRIIHRLTEIKDVMATRAELLRHLVREQVRRDLARWPCE